ncbi:MAG: valine--tRNA ligase [Bacteroidota bacterium]
MDDRTPDAPLPETPPAAPPPEASGGAYDPTAVEAKWYPYWEDGGFFHADSEAVTSGEKVPFVIPMPPPNVTGRLHMGHALQDTVQDLLIRMKRMQGYEALWIPGQDHAGIATQNVVERTLRASGMDRKEMGREAFLEKVWEWREEYGDIILQQKRRMGDSCDWRYSRFTMDEGLSRAVQEVFVRLHEQGLVYKGEYLVNWDPENQTVISNEEVDNVERPGSLWTIRYPVVDADGADTPEALLIATTRPETIPADTAVAVHPDDERFQHLIGQRVRVPVGDRLVPVIADEAIRMDFGAGALKVTPGHSEVDWEIGKRHDIEVLSIMNLDGTLNELAGAYAGMERTAAKKQIVADLDAAGYLVGTEDYTVTTPISSRSKAVIEPLLSPQWYVKMGPLAEKAVAAVEDGTVTFHPERWANEYRRWMDGIRDWPISRQLWWGHRIPVWYHTGDNGEIDESRDFVVSVDQPEPGMVQDEDVLDTWFSSWLWPFATLGWPDPDTPTEAADMASPEALKAFYPASVLVSGYDILFFWIARMVMAGSHFTGQAPFRDVFITGMIKDKQGRWMSKSLGNGIDPLDMIEQYGADAVRFTLSVLCAQGQDIKLDPAKFEGGRNFANKIWNASRVFGRFIETDADGFPTTDARRQRPFADLSLVERWIVTRLTETTESVTESLARFRISEAAQTLYDFLWNDFCDWYLELIKPQRGDDGEMQPMDDETLGLAVEVFEGALKLLHPFMPFLTEELWWKQRPRHARGALIAADWPEPADRDPEAAALFATVQDLVSAVRQVRAQYGVAPSKPLAVTVSVGGDDAQATATALESVRGYIERLARVDDLILAPEADKPAASAAVVVDRHQVFVPLAGMIDLDAERARLSAEIEDKRGFLASVERKLANENFVARAPEAVVAKERRKGEDARAEIAALEANLADLG